MFYREVEKNDRIYVFAQAATLEDWAVSGEVGRGLTRLAYGPKGETVVFDSDDALVLFNMRHGRPYEAPPPTTRMVPGPGALRVPTLGDVLAQRRPGARVVSLSAKDRSAIFMAGRRQTHAAYWYDQDNGRFVTSPFYVPPAPLKAVVDGWNRSAGGALLPARFGLAWKKLAASEPASAQPLPRPAPALDMLDYQLPSNGLGWDHPLTVNTRGYFSSLYYSPFTDELLADLALAFLQNESLGLGRRAIPDLLWLSFSAQDVVSHSYGVESEENLDVLRRLDLQLGRVLQALDARPKGSVVLALSSDHGFPVIPEAERQRNPAFRGGRLLTADRAYPTFPERLNRLLAVELCLDPDSRVLFGMDGFSIAYNRPAFPLDRRRRLRLRGDRGGRRRGGSGPAEGHGALLRRGGGSGLPGLGARTLAEGRGRHRVRGERLRSRAFGRRAVRAALRRDDALGPRAGRHARQPLRLRHPRAAPLLGRTLPLPGSDGGGDAL